MNIEEENICCKEKGEEEIDNDILDIKIAGYNMSITTWTFKLIFAINSNALYTVNTPLSFYFQKSQNPTQTKPIDFHCFLFVTKVFV